MTVFIMACIAHLLRVLSRGVKPFDWMAWLTEVVVVALIAYEIWGKERLQARSRKRALRKTFTMTFDDESSAKAVRFGKTAEIDVNILIGQPTLVNRFNLRFVMCMSKKKPWWLFWRRDSAVCHDAGDVAQVVAIRSRLPTDPDWQKSSADKKGGCNMEWTPRSKSRAGEALYLTVTVEGKGPWKGLLSFRGYDADDQVRFVRQPFEFTAV